MVAVGTEDANEGQVYSERKPVIIQRICHSLETEALLAIADVTHLVMSLLKLFGQLPLLLLSEGIEGQFLVVTSTRIRKSTRF